MRRYAQAFLIVALFCFLFPFTAITPANNTGALSLTGWDMLFPQDITVSKEPPIILDIPLRLPVLLALIFGAVAVLVKLARRSNTAAIVAAATSAAAVALITVTTSSPLVQLTDGHTVQHVFENPGVQILPAFYVSMVLMVAAAVTSWMNLQKSPNVQAAAVAASFGGVRSPAARSTQPVPAGSFCIRCGGGLGPAARFCNRCGATVVAAPAPQAPPSPATVTNIPAPAVEKLADAPAVFPAAASASLAPSPVLELASRPLPAPAGRVRQVVAPSITPLTAPKRGWSAGGKLGFAAGSAIAVAAVWMVFHNSLGNIASVSAPTEISLYPATITVAPGETVRLQAMVTGGMDRDVQWSIQEGTPGGSVEAAGATVQNGNVFLVATYKAPYLPGTYHVIAVSTVDQTRKAVAQVVVGYSFTRPFTLGAPRN